MRCKIGYTSLFISAFLAATVLPVTSEIVIVSMLIKGFDPVLSVTAASAGNILGAVLNYYAGFYGSRFIIDKFLRTRKEQIEKTCTQLEKYGEASLLLAWAPVIGDPLTIAAGILRVNFWIFLFFVSAGKILRYIILTWSTIGISNLF